MAIQFNCPRCGAPIQYEGEEANIPCPYCNSPVKVPVGTSLKRWWKSLGPTGKVIFWLVIVLFVLPTCIGLAASIMGGAIGICVPFLAFIPALFGK
jgi:DNA-directed RNA polymerase subunit RPC12/RpoP